ncbi:hypothetical protein Tco_1358793 [Tanacetum coccineum]
MLFHQFKMQMQMNKQQQSNQFTTSQPHSEQQSHHLVDETEEEEEEPVPTPTSKANRGRKKSVAKRTKEMWKLRKKPKKDEFDMRGPKPRNVYNQEANKKGFQERTKNMLTGKWTPMNVAVMKFNHCMRKRLLIVGRTMRTIWRGHKWKNPESTLQRRSRLRGTDKEPDHFGDDELPRTQELWRIIRLRLAWQNAKVLRKRSEDRRRLIQAQKIAEDMKVLQIDTSGMDPTYAVIINAQKERIRAEYLPPN